MKRPLWNFGLVLAVTAGFAFVSQMEFVAAQEVPALTPRTLDGKPDLSGMWDAIPSGLRGTGSVTAEQRARGVSYASRRCPPNMLALGCREHSGQANDGELTGRSDPNRPLYKPEYWDKVQELDYNTNQQDPMFQCLPDGIPRVGPPRKIVQTPNEVIFFYAGPRDHHYRTIPIDGRKHDPIRSQDISFYGDAVGTWEGDTLVVDSRGFTDATWIAARGGYLHSTKMRVIERFKREGLFLRYDVTVEDPEVLLRPWVMDTRVLRLNPQTEVIYEGDLCRDYDPGTMTSRVRH